MSYAVLDVETTIKSSFKRKANPFHPDNWVVYVGLKSAGSASLVTRFTNPFAGAGWLVNILEPHDKPAPKILVGFNIKFDILHAIAKDADNLRAWMRWVADGGIVWDCQLAEYLLGGMLPELQMLSLDEVAPLYGGELKIDEVKALWEAGIDTPDIPEDLLTAYLHGDCDNTTKIFLGQVQKARDCGQTKSIVMNMGSLLYTIEAERNGMYVDKALGEEIAAELEIELAKLTSELNAYIPKDLPFQFNWGSNTQKSALIFGGSVKYTGREYVLDAEGNKTYYQTDELHFVLEDGRTVPCAYFGMADGEDDPRVQYKGGKNAGEFKTKKVKVNDIERGPKMRNCDMFYQFPGFTEPEGRWKTATEGVYQTNNDVMEALATRDIPFLNTLTRRAAVAKDLDTYFITDDPKKPGQKKGMLTLVGEDGIIHHQINHTNTVTARFSSSNPNLQNLSSKGKSKVKTTFKSRWLDQGVIIQSDFTALEIYIQAILTGDKQLIKDLLAGLDMHCSRVATKEGIAYEEVVRLVKEVKDAAWIAKRKGAKEFSFQRAYGAGAAAISAATGLHIDDVNALIAAEMLRYPEIEPFFEELTRKIEGSKRGIRKVIPHPDFPAKQVELRTGFYRDFMNKLYTYLEQPAPRFLVERRGIWTSFSPPEIKNYIVQGGGAEWAKAAMWLAVRAFYSRNNFDGKALLVNQVHDATYADSHKSVALESAATLHACMELASDFIEWYFGKPLPVKVPTETVWGESMADEEEIPGVKELADKIKVELKQTFFKH